MRINAQMVQYQQKIIPQECTVDDVVDLSAPEYDAFMENLGLSKKCFIDRINANPWQGERRRCLLVLGIGREDGILVDTQGSAYAVRTAFIPNARTILQSHIKQLADYAVSEGTQHSEDTKWETSYEELYNHFGANITSTNGNCKMLLKELQRRQEIDELTVTEDGIDIVYKPEYCKNLVNDGKEVPARKLYAAYGRGLDMGLMKIRCPNTKLVGRGELEGYRLQFKGGQACITEKAGEFLPVAIWKVPPSDTEKFCSWLKPGGSKMKTFPVLMEDGKEIKAIGFTTEYDDPFLLPPKNLYHELYQGYLDHGFDINILTEALIDCTKGIYAKNRGARIEQRTPYQEENVETVDEEECSETQLYGMTM